MVPYVFISSTVADLKHLREALRNTISGLGYHPVLSEQGDVCFVGTGNAEESCYRSIQDCQLFVLIVGKRYGSLSTANNLSVTHNEFRTAQDNGIPTITLVDNEVLVYKKVYDAAVEDQRREPFPDMDAPPSTFGMIDEIHSSAVNNGILSYANMDGACDALRKQFAHLFGDFLRGRFPPVRREVQDVLAEIKALRQEMSAKGSRMDTRSLSVFRFLVHDENADYRHLIERTLGPIDTAIEPLVNSLTFDEFVRATGIKVEIKVIDVNMPLDRESDWTYISHRVWGPPEPGQTKPPIAGFGCREGKRVVMNETAKRMFDFKHEQLRLAIGGGSGLVQS